MQYPTGPDADYAIRARREHVNPDTTDGYNLRYDRHKKHYGDWLAYTSAHFIPPTSPELRTHAPLKIGNFVIHYCDGLSASMGTYSPSGELFEGYLRLLLLITSDVSSI
jgi:hypothetical protein